MVQRSYYKGMSHGHTSGAPPGFRELACQLYVFVFAYFHHPCIKRHVLAAAWLPLHVIASQALSIRVAS